MHPPLPTPTAVDAAPTQRPADGARDRAVAHPRRSVGRRAGAVMALSLTLMAAGAACSKTDQIATNQTTTVAPATTRPAADSAAGAGTTLGTRPGTTTGTLLVTTTTDAQATTTTSPSSTTTTGDPSTTATTVPGTPADLAFCAKGIGLADTLQGLDPTKDPTAMAKYKQAFVELNAAAPPEVQADMNQINTIIQSLTSFDKLGQEDTQKLDDAGKRVDVWALAHCGRKFG